MPSGSVENAFESLVAHFQDVAKLTSIGALLGWDERTMLPSQGGAYRAEQSALLAGIVHQRSTSAHVGEWLDLLADSDLTRDPYSPQGATIRELHRQYEKQRRVPQSLVENFSRATVLGQQAWVEARKKDDFEHFKPKLETILNLTREKAEAIGYEDSIYDPLLDDYEPGESTSRVAEVLGALRDELAPLVAQIAECGVKAPNEIIHRDFCIDAQARLGRVAAKQIGFDFESGRLDVTAHPFCTTLGPADCRILTRYEPTFFSCAFFGTLHEAGHGIYEQGLPSDQFGLPPGDYCSLGVHESQSRLWENLVGRGRAFWRYFYPQTQTAFPGSLADVAEDDFFFAINHVEPSLIRVEADEATYNLHIIIRFELEQALLEGTLSVDDLPGAWDEQYQKVLGVRSPTAANGVLQDVHWSAGLFGYFATYSLGNLYASQLFEAATDDLGDLDPSFARGDFTGLRSWLQERIYSQGRCKPAAELVRGATGQELGHDALMRHLRSKYGSLYGFD
jgi:carboxypeptidase Taq